MSYRQKRNRKNCAVKDYRAAAYKYTEPEIEKIISIAEARLPRLEARGTEERMIDFLRKGAMMNASVSKEPSIYTSTSLTLAEMSFLQSRGIVERNGSAWVTVKCETLDEQYDVIRVDDLYMGTWEMQEALAEALGRDLDTFIALAKNWSGSPRELVQISRELGQDKEQDLVWDYLTVTRKTVLPHGQLVLQIRNGEAGDRIEVRSTPKGKLVVREVKR